MTKAKGTTINILGKDYQVKCAESDLSSLQRAATYLEEKMRHTRDVGKVLSIDRIAVITALNIAHQFLSIENQSSSHIQTIQQRLRDLQSKVENALEQNGQLEFSPAE